MMYQIGDKLWVTSDRKRSYEMGGKDGRECMVTKVGRKWVYFTTSWRDDTPLGRIARFHIETGYVDGGEHISPGRVWPSREAHGRSQLRHKEWANFQEFVRLRYTLPDADYLHALEEQVAVMKLYTPIL